MGCFTGTIVGKVPLCVSYSRFFTLNNWLDKNKEIRKKKAAGRKLCPRSNNRLPKSGLRQNCGGTF